MIGTASWLYRTVQAFDAIGRSLKALPAPAELYRAPSTPTVGPISFPGWNEWERDHGGVSRDVANAKTAVNSVAVFSDVQAIANEFSTAELLVKRPGEDGTLEDVAQHPLEDLWRHPNRHMGRSYLMSFWAWSYVLMGKAYLYWVPAGGQIREVWPIPSAMLTPARDPKRVIKGYWFKVTPEAEPQLIPAEYITYSRSVNPFDPMDGMSFLAATMTEIRGDIASAAWNTNFFSEHNGVPDGIIGVQKDTLDSELWRIRQELRDFFGGTKRGLAVVRDGDLKYTGVGRSQKDAEFLEGRRFAQQVIGRALGFPDGYWSESANRANAEQARATMIAGAVWPLLVRLAEDLNAQLMPRWYGADERVEFKDIRPEDRQLKLAELAAYKEFLTIDELRDKIGMQTIGDVRGDMLVAEINKGMPTPASAPAQEADDYSQAVQDEQPPAPEAAPLEQGAAPPEGAPVEGEPMAEDMTVKALRLWETKALNTLRKKGRATCVFQSDALDDATIKRISAALADCRTPQDVRAAFKALEGGIDDAGDSVLVATDGRVPATKGGRNAVAVAPTHAGRMADRAAGGADEADALIDQETDAALEWARKVLAGE